MRRRADQEARGDSRSGDAMTRGLERNEDHLRLNPESGSGQLDETGGFLVRDTNDATPGSAASRRTCASITSVLHAHEHVLRRALPHDRGEGGAPNVTVQTRKGTTPCGRSARGAGARL